MRSVIQLHGPKGLSAARVFTSVSGPTHKALFALSIGSQLF